MSYHNPKLQRGDGPDTSIKKLADGHAPAEHVLRALSLDSVRIDPKNVLGMRAPLHYLDWMDIYGKDIVRLYSAICDGSTTNVLTLLRAVELGILPVAQLHAAIAEGKLDQATILHVTQQVRNLLPEFGKNQPDTRSGSPDGFDALLAALFCSMLSSHIRTDAKKAPEANAATAGDAPGKDAAKTPYTPEEAAEKLKAVLSTALDDILPGGTLSNITIVKVESTSSAPRRAPADSL